RGAPTYRAGRDWHTRLGSQGATLEGPWGIWRGVELALAGPHQVENAGLALMALWLLDARLVDDETRVRAALAGLRWPGRFERIASRPAIYVDGAHNVDSIERLVQTLRPTIADHRLTVVLGISR